MNPNTFRKVSPRFWTGDTGRQIRSLGHEAQVIAMYLLTCPSSDMSGLYYLPLPTLAHECGSPLQGASKGLRALSKLGFAHYDEASEQVFVVEMARIQMGEKLSADDKKRLGLVSYLETCKSPFLHMFYDRYQAPYKLPPRGFEGASEGLARGIATKTKTEIETQSETEMESKPTKEPKPPKPKPERFAPEDFAPTDAHIAKAKELGLNVEREAWAFKAHEYKTPKTDWYRAFTTWLLKSAQYGTRSGAPRIDFDQQRRDREAKDLDEALKRTERFWGPIQEEAS